MVSLLPGILLVLLVLLPPNSDAQFEQWCIADEQTEDKALQQAMDWACAQKDVDCSKIGENQACYLPNTLTAHASYVFNEYYQNYKHKGASCYFNAAAITTERDPSHNSCKFDFIP